MLFKLDKLQFLYYALPVYDINIRVPNNFFHIIESSDDYIDTLENRYDIHEDKLLVNGKSIHTTFGSVHHGKVTKLYLMSNGEIYFESDYTQEEFKRSVTEKMNNAMLLAIEKPRPEINDYIGRLNSNQAPLILEGKEVGYVEGEGKEYKVHITEPGLFERIVSFTEEDGRVRAKGSECFSIRSEFPPKTNYNRGQPTARGGYFYPKFRGLPRTARPELVIMNPATDPALNPNDKED